MNFVISEQQVVSVLDYLENKPFKEVALLINLLTNLQQVNIIKKEQKETCENTEEVT